MIKHKNIKFIFLNTKLLQGVFAGRGNIKTSISCYSSSFLSLSFVKILANRQPP